MLPLHRTTSSATFTEKRRQRTRGLDDDDDDDSKGFRKTRAPQLLQFAKRNWRTIALALLLLAVWSTSNYPHALQQKEKKNKVVAAEVVDLGHLEQLEASSTSSTSTSTSTVSVLPAALPIDPKSVTFDLLDDSLRLPMDPAKFNHNFPPFLSSMPNMTDSKRKEVWASRTRAVERAFSHAWDGYVKYAWNEDELRPESKKGDSWLHMGLTILDALDTALVIGNKTISDKARDWVVKENGLKMNSDVNANVFETTIRVIGGLLSAYHLSGNDPALLVEAKRVADKFLPAFVESKSGIPMNSIHLKSGHPVNPGGTYSSTAEATTIQLEFKYLTHLTGDPKYWNAAQKVFKTLFQTSAGDKTAPWDGLVPVYLDHTSGNFVGNEIRLGSRADSYYEYLAKQYLLTNQTEPFFLQQYRTSLHKGIKKHLLMRSSPNNLLYIREHAGEFRTNGGSFSEKFDHLVCYLGGTLALTATKGKRITSLADRAAKLTPQEREELYLGEELARSCFEMYHQTATGLASEIVFWRPSEDTVTVKKELERTWARFAGLGGKSALSADAPVALETVKNAMDGEIEVDFSIHSMDTHNLLRPEAVETFFVLWRITGDEKYREWGWRVFRSFEQWSKVATGGYTSLNNVNVLPPPSRDKMESFFLGETLKYFYLLFSDSSVLPLDEYVFNTECHPLPIFQVSEELEKKVLWM